MAEKIPEKTDTTPVNEQESKERHIIINKTKAAAYLSGDGNVFESKQAAEAWLDTTEEGKRAKKFNPDNIVIKKLED